MNPQCFLYDDRSELPVGSREDLMNLCDGYQVRHLVKVISGKLFVTSCLDSPPSVFNLCP